VRLAYTRAVVAGGNPIAELLEADPEMRVVFLSIEQYRVERGGLEIMATESPFIKLTVDTLLPFLPLAIAIPRLTWRNRLILLLIGLGVLYLVQVGLLLVFFRCMMASAYLDPKLDDVRHLVPFRYSLADIKFYQNTIKQFWTHVGYYWTGPVVGLGLGAWLLSRQQRAGNERE